MALFKDQQAYRYDIAGLPRVEAARRGAKLPGTAWGGIAPSFQLSYVVNGSIESQINGQPFLAKAGRIYLSGAGDVCRQRTEHGCETYYALFSWEQIPGSAEGTVWPLGSPHEIILSAGARKKLNVTFENLVSVFAEGKPGWEAGAAGYLLVILAILTSELGCLEREVSQDPSGTFDKRVAQSLDFMRRNMHRNFKIAEVAEAAGVTQDYLFGLFHRRLGLSPLQYLIQLRVQEARRLMALDPGLSVKEACRKSGMANPQHFSRLFKRRYGQTPSDFQKQQRLPV